MKTKHLLKILLSGLLTASLATACSEDNPEPEAFATPAAQAEPPKLEVDPLPGEAPKPGPKLSAGQQRGPKKTPQIKKGPEPIPAPADVAAPPADAQKTASGLAFKVLTPATGDTPGPNDTVQVHYTGWTTDGKMFDSSVSRGAPATFPLNGVIPGWSEGLQMMSVGEKRRLWIPETLAYQGQPGKPAGMLVFDVELLKITEKGPTPPENLTAAPADAQKTPAGIPTRVVTAGTGEAIGPNDMVKFHITGWKPDGTLVEDSRKRGQPINQGLGVLPEGWQETLAMMKVGETRRAWMTAEQSGSPRGMKPTDPLVWDFQVVDVKKGPESPQNVAAPPADAQKTASGIAYTTLKPGTGEAVAPGDTIEFHYSAWKTDGSLIEDSRMRQDDPIPAPIERLPKGWQEVLSSMKAGESRRAWMTEAQVGQPPRPGAAPSEEMIVFDFEIVDVKKAIQAPADVAAPPADAEKTASGLASRVLTPGTGDKKPTAQNMVKVHYSGWTTDGKMFDSSVMRGTPATFPLSGVIPGWTEGVQLMTVGEKRRFWIPEALAYKGQPGKPAGMLVFDVELLEIMEGAPSIPGMPPGMRGAHPGNKPRTIKVPPPKPNK